MYWYWLTLNRAHLSHFIQRIIHSQAAAHHKSTNRNLIKLRTRSFDRNKSIYTTRTCLLIFKTKIWIMVENDLLRRMLIYDAIKNLNIHFLLYNSRISITPPKNN